MVISGEDMHNLTLNSMLTNLRWKYYELNMEA